MRLRPYLPALAPTLLLAILAGCQTPGRVIEALPPPILHTPPAPPPLPPPPPPPPVTGRPIRGAVIVIDPGHGGRDPGALPRTGGQWPEKTIVLDIASRVARLVGDRGARTVLTRNSDTFLELQDRCDLAERQRADLFISIHANSAERRSASGTGIYIHTQASAQSQKAAFRLMAALNRAGIECTGISRKNFHVLREHSRPAVLIECGFMTNASDAQKLNSPAYRARLATAIADGLTSYFAP